MVPPLRRVTFFKRQKSNQKRWAPAFGTSLWLGVPSFRDSSGGIAYGLLRCTSSRCMRLRRTVAALPPPDKSLHSAFRWGRHVKSFTRANAHCVEWREARSEKREAGSKKQEARSKKQEAEGNCVLLDRSHAPRGNVARDAPRSIFECLKMCGIYRIFPFCFSLPLGSSGPAVVASNGTRNPA
ncbi:hypothetical protein GGI52_000952 [Pseudomonas moraviensis]|uniref:Uncharacterized protein n=1 Tax=Pseudomonas moraviensis TaxID=321662 RepID=A0A7Z0ASB5_9PSED|nr:hypothetical protein [Pseudomonas moraviensis]